MIEIPKEIAETFAQCLGTYTTLPDRGNTQWTNAFKIACIVNHRPQLYKEYFEMEDTSEVDNKLWLMIT